MVGQLVVIAIVAEVGGPLRKFAEIGFILLVKQRVLGGDACGNRLQILVLRGERKHSGKEEDQILSKVHKFV